MKHEEAVKMLLCSGAILIPDSSPQFIQLNKDAHEQGYTLLIAADGTYLAVNANGEIMPFVVVKDEDSELKGVA